MGGEKAGRKTELEQETGAEAAPGSVQPASKQLPEVKTGSAKWLGVAAVCLFMAAGVRIAAYEHHSLSPGETFKDCANCPEMVVVPAGSFLMGLPPSELDRYRREGPQRLVTISQPFAVGKYEVTFNEWDKCVAGGGCGGFQALDEGWGRGRQPVKGASWDDAKAYVAWLSGETGQPYRLLSEAEWEYAARAGSTTSFWRGDDIGRNNASCDGCGSQWDRKQTAPVGSFRPNDFGVYDMAGNVWEWVEDCWNGSHDGAPRDGSVRTEGHCEDRVLRGGAWNSHPESLRSAIRARGQTGQRYDNRVGFRVARTLP